MKHASFSLLLLLGSSTVSGCAGQTLDGGSDRGGSKGTGSGALDQGSPSPPPPVSSSSATPAAPTPAPTPAPGDLVGTWEMTAQDGPPGELSSDPTPPIQLAISPSGEVYRARCARDPGDTTLAACPAGTTYDCLPGVLVADGDRWRVDIPGIRVGGASKQGQIVREAGGGVLVLYINPSYSGGHFRRVDAASPVACR